MLLRLIAFYQRWVSPFFLPRCRFVPSCSNYAMEAIEKHGAGRGTLMAVWRVCRCNPCNPGGYDPVSEPADFESTQPDSAECDDSKARTTVRLAASDGENVRQAPSNNS
ncbi:MAG: membrane protein insertion efficiency factor YidD [Granulosicoccus sp.]|nr:membrane protein insertion efficiency factor YidD [Granulosicoccus sp.]